MAPNNMELEPAISRSFQAHYCDRTTSCRLLCWYAVSGTVPYTSDKRSKDTGDTVKNQAVSDKPDLTDDTRAIDNASAVTTSIAEVAAITQVPSNDPESYTWNFFINKGYSQVHTAAIMGNLKQEHGFKTDDVAGGLGVAQWLGNRRSALMAMANYDTLPVQLEFITIELDGVEGAAKSALLASQTVESATIAFQNLYERCHPDYCMQNQRIQYAWEFMQRYS